MLRFKTGCTLFTLLGLLCVGSAAAQEEVPVNLLRLRTATIAETTAPLEHRRDLPALTDANPKSHAVVPAGADAPLDVVYQFQGTTVTPQKVSVWLAPVADDAPPAAARIEVLVSTVSARAGFHSLRSDPLKPSTAVQEFEFRPAAAKWVMLRITPAAKADRVAIADVALYGRDGPPATVYAFKEAPAKAADVLQRLKATSSVDVALSADDQSLLEDARDGHFDRWTFGDAALYVSGLTDTAQRKKLLAKLDELEAAARKQLADQPDLFAKGEALLTWLHEKKHLERYIREQTELTGVLEDGTYNCVSSAVLYNVLAKRLGLDARAIEVPDHAFAILYDGTRHADVETTTPDGFNPSRDKQAQADFENLTGFRYIPDEKDKRREINEAGLIALIAYNHGVGHFKAGRYAEALGAYFRAMSLDGDNTSAVTNTLAALGKWSLELSDARQFEKSLAVIRMGLELAPMDAGFQHNRRAIWEEWIDTVIKTGDSAQALALVRKAAAALPDANFQELETWVYIGPAEELAKAQKYEAALAKATAAVSVFQGEQLKEIQDYRANVMSRWFIHELEAEKFADAAEILHRTLEVAPNEKDNIYHNFAYLAQKWSTHVAQSQGSEPAEALINKLIAQYPDVPTLKEVAIGNLAQAFEKQVKDKRYEAAVDVAHRAGDKELETKLARYAYNSWAIELAEKQQWQQAADVYRQARSEFPDDANLKRNEHVVWAQWSHALSEAKELERALDVYGLALKRFPGDSAFIQNAAVTWSNIARAHVEKNEWQAAFEVFDRARKQLPNNGVLDQNEKYLLNRRINPLLDGKKWEQAIDALGVARGRFPQDGTFKNNLAYCYSQLLREFVDAEDWAGGVKICQRALGALPGENVFRQNEVICWTNQAQVLANKQDWPAATKILEAGLQRYPRDDQLLDLLKFCKEQGK